MAWKLLPEYQKKNVFKLMDIIEKLIVLIVDKKIQLKNLMNV
jgi:hypothetical protein